jgi:hypothetical protein
MAGYLTILFLQLNAAVPLGPAAIGPLALALWLSYGLHAAVFFYVVLVIRQLFAEEPLSPGWVSVKLLAWLCACCAAIAAAIAWLNLRNFRLSLTDEAARGMALGAATFTVCAVLFLLLAGLRHSIGRPGRAIGGWLLAAIAVASLAGPLWWRGPGIDPPPGGALDPAHAFTPRSGSGRVILIALDGASLDFISPAAADGRLPNFGRILDSGAVMHLATLRPTQAAPVWTSVATGKLPPKTGVRSAARFRPFGTGTPLQLLPDYCFAHALVSVGAVTQKPLDATAVRAPAIWEILGASGISSGIVRWPITYPARITSGVLVSDRFHHARESAAGLTDLALTSPSDIIEPALADRARAPEPLLPALPRERLDAVSGPIAADRVYAAVAERLSQRSDLHLIAVRYEGLDAVGHFYLREAMPRAFGDVGELERRQYGRVLEQYYRYIDERIGAAIDETGRDDLLLVVSGFGMQPLSLVKRVLERVTGDTAMSGTHERAPDGFLLAWGRSVRAGRYPRAAVVDVTPTLLYFFGLPIGRDMDGFARTDIFTRAFTDDRPLSFIRSYER